MNLPELPSPAAEAVMDLRADHEGPVEAMQYLPEGTEFYTTEQMHAFYRAGYLAALEDAARVCDETADIGALEHRAARRHLAASIRALGESK